MKNVLLSTAVILSIAVSGCASTATQSEYVVKLNGIDASKLKKKGLSNTEITLFVLGAGAVAYVGLSAGNRNKTPQSTIDARDACRAMAQTEEEYQSC